MKKKRFRKPNATGRSAADVKHVRLHRWVMESAAWRSLSIGARALLPELYLLYNGGNNGELFLSTRDAGRRLGVSKSSASRLFMELESRGFIRARQRGAFSLKVRHATIWILAEFEHASQPPTMDFMRWRPPQNSETGATDGTGGATGGTVARPCTSKKALHGGTGGTVMAKLAQ